MQPPFGGEREAALLRDGDEIAEMTQLHPSLHASEVCRQAYEVLVMARNLRLDSGHRDDVKPAGAPVDRAANHGSCLSKPTRDRKMAIPSPGRIAHRSRHAT